MFVLKTEKNQPFLGQTQLWQSQQRLQRSSRRPVTATVVPCTRRVRTLSVWRLHTDSYILTLRALI